ncbi:acyl-CoA dehydrogenase C-terminal domain-containing protein [Nocardia xishanensis]|uniref:Acyl-CoA dehydrogenase C-terminal domain-containing protein n=1 Tax=Nocardia xishanensis TaxID=238964 RepID=A0ABW7X7E0_9NOCA
MDPPDQNGRTTGFQAPPTEDPAVTSSYAFTYLEAVGHVVIAWIWLEQFLVSTSVES